MKKLFNKYSITDCMSRAASKPDFNLLIGRKIWIISCPRKTDGADAYANIEGVIDEVLSDGGMVVKLSIGGSLIIASPHLKNLNFVIL